MTEADFGCIHLTELKAQRQVQVQMMAERKAAKAAAKKEQQEKAKAARAASLAAKAIAKAAEAEAAAQQSAHANWTSREHHRDAAHQLHSMSGLQYSSQAANSDDLNRDVAAASRNLNGYVQHSQHAQRQTGHTTSHLDNRQLNGMPARRNGYHLPKANQHSGQLAGAEGQAGQLEGQIGWADMAHTQQHKLSTRHHNVDMVYNSPDKGGLHDHSASASPEVDIMNSISTEKRIRGGECYQQHQLHSGSAELGPDAESGDRQPARFRDLSCSGQLSGEAHASESDAKRHESELADDKFDWEAWMSPEERKGIAERLQRARRPPKRPYSPPEPPKPKAKKHQTLKSRAHPPAWLPHSHSDRLLRQESGSTSSSQFGPDNSHASDHWQHAHTHRPGSAMPGRAATGMKAKGKSKGRRALEEVGCIRAAAYQGEAFMQARMDVLQQQGVLPSNQAPADSENGHQVSCQLGPGQLASLHFTLSQAVHLCLHPASSTLIAQCSLMQSSAMVAGGTLPGIE